MSEPISRLNAARASFAGLILLLALVVSIRAASDAPGPTSAGGERTSDAAGASAQEAGSGAVAATPVETEEPPLATGCLGSGSTRAEVSAVMGAPDSIVFGEWLYGRSGVTFGYGTVLDYSNEGDNLRLCP